MSVSEDDLREFLHEVMPPQGRERLRETCRGDDDLAKAMRRLLDCLDRDGDDLMIQWEGWRQALMTTFHREGLIEEGKLVARPPIIGPN